MKVAWAMVMWLVLSLALGCASGRPDRFVLPIDELTYEEWERLVRKGEEVTARGHKALRAVRMLDEAEELRQKGDQLEQETLPA